MEFATGAMGSLLPKLGELLKEEYKLQKGVREQVQSLSRELTMMHAALRKVAEVQSDQLDEQVKLWAREVRELSYDMEDIVDTFLVRVKGHEATNPHRLKRLMEKMGELFSKAKTRHQIAIAIKDIKDQVQEVASRRARYRVDNILAKHTATSTIDPRLLAMYKDAAQLIGIDGPRDALINMMSNGDDVPKKKMKIVSVFGFGGLGKTTLAKAVYDNLKIGFDCCAFVPVGQNPNMKKVLRDICIDLEKENYKKLLDKQNANLDVTMLDERQLFNQPQELLDKQKHTNLDMMALDERQLINQLREFLGNKRYFIIIDDIWDNKSWKIIRCALADSNCGSRVVTTTRIFEVATNAGDVYKLQPLSRDNSKKLFNTRIVDCKGKCPHNQSTEVYDKILKKCGGVPLAIITIASLLASKPGEDWSEVYSSIGFGHGDNNDVENTRKILSYSYYDLPAHLRTCLLYLSVFPEDYCIKKSLLIWKWIAEGFVHDKQGIGLLEVGEIYFNELINRSMIKPSELADTGYVTGCHVHDMVLDLIRSLSSEENFVTILDNEQQTFSHRNARRLAFHRIKEHNPLANMGVRHVRSFTPIRCDIGMISPSFRVLRTLAIENCGFMEGYNSLEHIGNLLHLRYLGLTDTPIHGLPKEIGDLKFLQTLELIGTGIEELPSSVGMLTQLVCLRADYETRVPDCIGNLTSLQQLWIHPAADRSTRFVKDLGNLREMRMLGTSIDVQDESLERALLESLGNLHKAQIVDMGGKALGKGGCMWETGFVFPRLLRFLSLGCLEFPRLPTWINLSLLPNLFFLAMKVQVVQEQDMETLGRLPQLRSLRLFSRYILAISIICGDGQLFDKLRFFTMNTSIRFVHGDCSMAPIMPSLEALEFDVNVRFLKDANLGFDKFGFGSLPSIQKVTARIICSDACAAEVEEAEAALRHTAAVHPNRPTLQTTRIHEDRMLSSGQEATRFNRKVVDLGVNVRKEKDGKHYFNFLELLWYPRVEKLSVCINCEDASVGEVEEAEAALKHVVDIHPNHPTLEIMMLPASYYDLPSHLRTCLLYLSVFPEDHWINKELLIWKWIAEGFVHDERGIGLLEVGERYFNELINISMIKPDEDPLTGYVHGCRVHHMVLDLARSLSKEEDFVTILDNEQQIFSQSNAPRLAFHRIKEHNPPANMSVQHVRSFTAIWCDIGMISPNFQVLHVLAIENCGFMEGYNNLEHLRNLLHLRYLGLTYTPIHGLPKEIGDLKFLQTLELIGTGIEELPSSVGLLTQLVCLRADEKTRVPDWIGNLTSLQELWIHPAADRSTRFVKDLGNLRELRMLGTSIDVQDESLERALLESLGNLHKVQIVDMGGKALGKGGCTWETGFVFPRLLRFLSLGCLEFSRLPTWINLSLLPNLFFLAMKVQVVQEQDMETLGRLPQLRSLRLFTRYIPAISIICGDGQLFDKLRFFRTNTSIRFVHGDCSMAPIMPSLEALEFDVNVRFLKDANLGFDKFGFGSLPSIQKVTARIICSDACAAEVEEAEAALRHTAAVHPNRPTLQMTRIHEDRMLSSGQEATRFNRKVVYWYVKVRKQKDEEHYFNFLSLLWNPRVEKVSLCINCEDASVGEVEEAEVALRHTAAVHPNRPTLRTTRLCEDEMLSSDQDQEQE